MSPSTAHAGLIYISLIQDTHALQQAMTLPEDCLQLLLKSFAPNNTSMRTTLTVCTQNLAHHLPGSKWGMIQYHDTQNTLPLI